MLGLDAMNSAQKENMESITVLSQKRYIMMADHPNTYSHPYPAFICTTKYTI